MISQATRGIWLQKIILVDISQNDAKIKKAFKMGEKQHEISFGKNIKKGLCPFAFEPSQGDGNQNRNAHAHHQVRQQDRVAACALFHGQTSRRDGEELWGIGRGDSKTPG
jgi:hypothetical protein